MKFRIAGCRINARSCAILIALACGATSPQLSFATVTPFGDVTPVVAPTGGNVPSTLIVGNTAYGQITNAIASGGSATPITITGSNDAVFGDDARVVGAGSFAGLGSNLTVGRNLLVGNLGTGTFTASQLARITANNNIILGVGDGSSGRLFVNDLGTVIEALDDIAVGQGGVGLLQILSGGRVFAETSTLGSNSTGDGTVSVSGSESLWVQSGAMTVGNAGRGFLQVVLQGRMETANAVIGSSATGVGNAVVNGTGSVWELGTMTLGSSGQGTLNVSDGGRVTNTGAARLGVNTGSEGVAIVSGASSVWNAGTSLNVGESGVGTMRVQAGGRVNSANSVIGAVGSAGGRGEVVVDGTGTIWEVAGTLAVSSGTPEGFLSISNGAIVAVSGQAQIGAAGELFMGGGRLNLGGSLVNSGLVQGGGRISGSVLNNAGGEIRTRSTNAMTLGGLQNLGLVHMDGGELEILSLVSNSSDIDITDAILRFPTLNNSAGSQLAFSGGESDVFGTITNSSGAQIAVVGGARAIFHDVVTNNGQIVVRPDSELIMLENLSFTSSAQLSLNLSSLSAEQAFASLDVAGSATLAGELSVQLSSGFVPEVGDEFKVLDAAGGRTGSFSNLSLPALGAGREWDVDYDATSVTLLVVAGPGGLTADFDGDGNVDADDLTRWRTNFGSTSANRAQGDADADGDVDGSDFLTWQRQLGTSLPASPAAAAVPEPASATLLAAGLALACAVCRRR